MNQGLVYVFTGDGKGKTSAALGVAMRAVASGMKVAMVQWYKEASWRISEHELPSFMPNFTIHPMGKGFHLKNQKIAPLSNGQVVVDKTTLKDHQQAAGEALKLAVRLLPTVDVLICDEINNALNDGLLEVEDVKLFLNQRNTTHVILSGRHVHPDIVALADLVSEIKKIKHPYDQGKLAVKGLDF